MPAAVMPAATRLFLAGNAVAMTGNGLVIAFTLIYLHQARGIALPVVGLLLATGAAAGLLAVTVSRILLHPAGDRPGTARLGPQCRNRAPRPAPLRSDLGTDVPSHRNRDRRADPGSSRPAARVRRQLRRAERRDRDRHGTRSRRRE